MEAFVERLMAERKELMERTYKLMLFMRDNPKFKELDIKMRYLMAQQLRAMNNYETCLRKRLSLLGMSEKELEEQDMEMRQGIEG